MWNIQSTLHKTIFSTVCIFVVIELSLYTAHIYLHILSYWFAIQTLTPLQLKLAILAGKSCDLSSFKRLSMISFVLFENNKMNAFPLLPLLVSFPANEKFCAIAQIVFRFVCDTPNALSNPWFMRSCKVYVKN